MGCYEAILVLGQLAGIVHEIEERLVNLADVVEERGPFDLLALRLRQIGGVGDDQRVRSDAADVRARFLVVGVDCIEQRLQRGGHHALGSDAVAAFPHPEVAEGGAGRGDEELAEDSHARGTGKKGALRLGLAPSAQRLAPCPYFLLTSPSPLVPALLPATVTAKGARRWELGHPWIYRSDVAEPPDEPAGAVLVRDVRGRSLGWALWSPRSEISLRLLTTDSRARIDAQWWRNRIAAAVARRSPLDQVATAFRLVHAEGDGCPSLIVDRYDRWIVVQLMSAGLERFRNEIVETIESLCAPAGILARNDAPLRAKEGLAVGTELLVGQVPHELEVVEHGVRYLAAPWDGQKTGAFLDQRENRALMGAVARGHALDCFSYHGSFALHLARRASHVTALDISAHALARAAENCARNELTNVELVEANAFDFLKARERAGDRFDTIVLDPPAFAKTRGALENAWRGYKEINLRAMRLLRPGGLLFSASCSYHVTKPLFLEMLQAAAADAGRRMALRELRGQPLDHPEVLTIPETGYIKGALLEAME